MVSDPFVVLVANILDYVCVFVLLVIVGGSLVTDLYPFEDLLHILGSQMSVRYLIFLIFRTEKLFDSFSLIFTSFGHPLDKEPFESPEDSSIVIHVNCLLPSQSVVQVKGLLRYKSVISLLMGFNFLDPRISG